MKKILIVDDERPFLLSLVDGLKPYSEEFGVLTAGNGQEALDIIGGNEIDLVLTDLKMPVMDGFEFIAKLSVTNRKIPVIVMTAFGTPEIEDRIAEMGSMHYLEKPMDIDALLTEIREALSSRIKGFIQGVSLPTFLQLMEMESKSSTLRIKSGDNIGLLYFMKGELVDAEVGTLSGEKAAYEIVCWGNTEIEVEKAVKRKRTIKLQLNNIMMEAFRLQDENNKLEKEGGNEEQEIEVALDEYEPEEDTEGSCAAGQTFNTEEILQGVNIMSVQDKLKEFSSIDGFAGVGVFTPTGESLAIVASDGVNLKDIGILANNVLMNAQKASLDMGTGRGQLVHVEAEKAQIIVRCLNEGTDPLKSQPGKTHIHLVLVLTSDSSIGLAKMKVAKVIEDLAADFRV